MSRITAASSLSVLQRATPSMVVGEPFPHLLVQDALPTELYRRLSDSYPPLWLVGAKRRENNRRWDYPCRKVRRNLLLPRLWRDFIAYHSSQAFFDEVAAVFRDHILATHPSRFRNAEALSRMRAGRRRVERFGSRDILLDALISGNTPVTAASSVRTTHIDAGPKLFSGLFYMRRPEDDSLGGDLEICRFKPDFADSAAKAACFDGPYVDNRHVEVVKTVTYAANTVILFINSLESLHGVSVRQPTPHPRLFVNLVGEVDPPLYQFPKQGRTGRGYDTTPRQALC
jgi:hypothetical protein